MPYLTDAQPGTGGILKQAPEDFVVEEIPAYEPCGSGEHLFLLVQKRSLTTHEAVSRLARALHVRERDVGFAGIKDARAVTTQWMSVPARDGAPLESLKLEGVAVLEAHRHRNKLRSGHLAGNRFRILLRKVSPDAEPRARATLEVLSRRGVPNAFGPQRFGVKGDSDKIGRALLQEDYDEALRLFLGAPSELERDARIHEARKCFEEGRLQDCKQTLPRFLRNEHRVLDAFLKRGDARTALARIPKSLRLLFLSAFQSRVFNRCLAERLCRLDRLSCGDVAVKHENGAAFLVRDLETEQPRAGRFEISPAGPLFGPGLLPAEGPVAETEDATFREFGVDPHERRSPFRDVHLRGERRPYRFPIREAAVETTPDGLRLSFELPRGCYATAVLAEVMKGAGQPAG